RRIQVRDCTLDQLHEHIQTAMGWENCHLHEFDIQGERYGDPQLLSEGVGDFVGIDSTKTRLSDILPAGTQPLGFRYTYDFGDGWDHDILYEGRPPCDPQVKYPVCLEGANACPPEDSGGVPGYENLLEALRDPKHEDHERLCEWVGDDFDPAAFDEKAATKAMQRGLPDWR
ncbi:MAG: plasmid pRiA4b ORF-3 family protein, partial [Planctomycetes bacterium]|nr:plasmid pRiA4b ORF-3 family protein [Planctomycetota bacterium]